MSRTTTVPLSSPPRKHWGTRASPNAYFRQDAPPPLLHTGFRFLFLLPFSRPDPSTTRLRPLLHAPRRKAAPQCRSCPFLPARSGEAGKSSGSPPRSSRETPRGAARAGQVATPPGRRANHVKRRPRAPAEERAAPRRRRLGQRISAVPRRRSPNAFALDADDWARLPPAAWPPIWRRPRRPEHASAAPRNGSPSRRSSRQPGRGALVVRPRRNHQRSDPPRHIDLRLVGAHRKSAVALSASVTLPNPAHSRFDAYPLHYRPG